MTFNDINCSTLQPFPCDTQNFAAWRHGGPGPTPTPHEALPDIMVDVRQMNHARH